MTDTQHFTITYRYEGEEQSKTFFDEASADLFLASLTTRRDSFLFTEVTKSEA